MLNELCGFSVFMTILIADSAETQI